MTILKKESRNFIASNTYNATVYYSLFSKEVRYDDLDGVCDSQGRRTQG